MSVPVDLGALLQQRAEDEAWFDRWPDRRYRLREAWAHECSGWPPDGYAIFVIVERRHGSLVEQFGAPIWFDTERSDGAIRGMLAALARDPRAYLRG